MTDLTFWLGAAVEDAPRFPSTRGDRRPPAVICRERGWAAGTKLIGDEGYGPTVIEITAIGERSILAKEVAHNGRPSTGAREGTWALDCRDWKQEGLGA